MKDCVNFRDLTRSVELFIVSKQVKADKISCENIYDVLGVADSGPRTEPWGTLQSTLIDFDWTRRRKKIAISL